MANKLFWSAKPMGRGMDVYLIFDDGRLRHGAMASLHEVPRDPLEIFQRMAQRMVRTAPASAPYLKSVIEAVPRRPHETSGKPR